MFFVDYVEFRVSLDLLVTTIRSQAGLIWYRKVFKTVSLKLSYFYQRLSTQSDRLVFPKGKV